MHLISMNGDEAYDTCLIFALLFKCELDAEIVVFGRKKEITKKEISYFAFQSCEYL